MKKMKTRFIVPLILFVLCTNVLITSCKNDNGDWQSTYTGLVVDQVTELPYANCDIRVTDGSNIIVKTKTDENGEFSITINMGEINDSFHFLFGSVIIGQKQVEFPSYAPGTYSLGTIYVNGPSAPSVETIEIAKLGSSSATIKCNITSNGGFAISARGSCWSTHSNPTLTDNYTDDGIGTGEFSSTIYGLQASTRYYVRAYATNEKGTNYGATLSFISSDGRPIVETTDPGENITASSISTGGQVVSDEGYPVTARGVVYSTLPYPTLENASKVESGSGIGYFSANITNVSPVDNTYYIRAYATNSIGTAYGEQITITPERSEYLSLPTIIYGGYKYHIYKDMGKGDWNTAMQLCDDLTFAGYDDWYLPDEYELVAMIQAGIDGWYFESYMSSYGRFGSVYWTSSSATSSTKYRYVVVGKGDDGYGRCKENSYSKTNSSTSDIYRFRAVRKDKIE